MWPSTHVQARWRGAFVDHDNITDIATYLRQFGPLLAERILETYPPLQSTRDPVAPPIASLLRKALPAQALAITGTAKYLRKAKSARIVAECGAGKTYMALGTIHVLADGRPSTTLVMCPSHITHKWAREVLLTIPCARAFLFEDMRNGGDPSRPHGICEVKLSKGKTVYESILVAYGIAASALAWNRHRAAVSWLVQATASVAALALGIATREPLPSFWLCCPWP